MCSILLCDCHREMCRAYLLTRLRRPQTRKKHMNPTKPERGRQDEKQPLIPEFKYLEDPPHRSNEASKSFETCLAGANYVAEGKDPLRAVPCQADAKQKGVQAHTGSFQNQRQTQALQAALNAYSIGSGSHTSIPAESFLFRPCRGCMTV